MAFANNSVLVRSLINDRAANFGLKNEACCGAKVVPPRKAIIGNGSGNKVRVIKVKATLQIAGSEEAKKPKQELSFDVASEGELREKGFLGMRKTKLVCTIGPACCSLEDLEKLALGGMNVARLNMCHNTRDWHRYVIKKIKKLNQEKGFCVSVMIDTEGSQIHVLDHGSPSTVKAEVKSFFPHFRV